MSQIVQTEPDRQALVDLVKRGLLREYHRRGGLTDGQFAQIMEERRGR